MTHSTRDARSGQALTEDRPLLHRPEAITAARAFVDHLDGTYDQLIVAGSLRRRLAYVGDVEIVAVPRTEPVTIDLLAEQVVVRDLLDERMADLLEAGAVEKRLDRNGVPRWGPTLKYATFQGIRVDLFCPEAERMGWILLLRTGPAAFSRQLVVERGKKTKDGRPGLRPAHVRCADGWLTWSSGERISTPTEAEACRVLGIPYAEPWNRE